MDKVVLDAKTEIDNALMHAVVSAGIKVLGLTALFQDKYNMPNEEGRN